jgi:hypothetical protein
MNDPLAWFWTVMIATSIGWYSFLLFYLGIKGGFEIFRMIRVFSAQKHQDGRDGPPGS